MLQRAQPDIDPKNFRQVLSHVPTSLVIVTTQTDQGAVGMVVGTFTSVSLNPLLVGFLAECTSHTGTLIQGAEKVTYNVPGAHDAHLLEDFRKPPHERFADSHWIMDRKSGPRLRSAVIAIETRAYGVFPAGDHVMVLNEVHRLHRANHVISPLVYLRGSVSTVHEISQKQTPA